MGLGSRYFFISDWPDSLAGLLYAFASWLGHFCFLSFTLYLLAVFPLTFLVRSHWGLRFLSAIIATVGLTLLLVDIEIFSLFHQHLNPIIWTLLINADQTEMAFNWTLLFIGIPVILMIEMLFVNWSWQKSHSITCNRIGKPLTTLLIVAFCTSHVAYIWADAHFYRPITMQRTNLPLSYPMTARRFLERYGLLDAQALEQHLIQHGNSEATAVKYPLSPLSFSDKGSGLNLLLIATGMLRNDMLEQHMPTLKRFAEQNIRFAQHYSTGNEVGTGLFGLFYGISTSYLDGIVTTRKSSALLDALNKQGYQLSLFSSDGFHDALYRHALLTDFTLPEPVKQTDVQTAKQWQQWRNSYRGESPWFSFVSFNGTNISNNLSNTVDFIRCYQQGAQHLDNILKQMLAVLIAFGDLDNTVVIITASTGVEFNDNVNERHKNGIYFNRAHLHVPLVVHWPGTPAQIVKKLTNHNDLTVTIMQRLLHASNRSSDYSQGEELFSPRRHHDWVLSAYRHKLAIITPSESLLLENNSSYRIFDFNGKELHKKKPQLTLLLQVLTNEKHFIVN